MKRQRERAKQQEQIQKGLRRKQRNAEKKEAKANGTSALGNIDDAPLGFWFGPLTTRGTTPPAGPR